MKSIQDLAREAGVDTEEADTLVVYKMPWFHCTAEELQRFAALVIEQERERIAARMEHLDPAWTAAEIAAVIRGQK